MVCRSGGVPTRLMVPCSVSAKYSEHESNHFLMRSEEICASPRLWALWLDYCRWNPKAAISSSLLEKQLLWQLQSVKNFSLPLPFKTSAVLASSAHIADTNVRVYSPGFCRLWAVSSPAVTEEHSSPLWELGPGYFGKWILFVQILCHLYTPILCNLEATCAFWNRIAWISESVSSVISCVGYLGDPRSTGQPS